VIDSHVFDTLSSILDFQKFKEMMLVFKNREDLQTTPSVHPEIANWEA